MKCRIFFYLIANVCEKSSSASENLFLKDFVRFWTCCAFSYETLKNNVFYDRFVQMKDFLEIHLSLKTLLKNYIL